jgi:hypothetical protein
MGVPMLAKFRSQWRLNRGLVIRSKVLGACPTTVTGSRWPRALIRYALHHVEKHRARNMFFSPDDSTISGRGRHS